MNKVINAALLGLGLTLSCAPLVHTYAATQGSTSQYVSDSALTAKVKAAIVGNEGISATDVNVITNNGVVQLNGTVQNQAQVNLAGKIAAGVTGVQQVQNNLQVKAPVNQ